MSKENSIKLKISSLKHVQFDLYEKDFTFIVNNQKYQRNRLIADILSPKISQMHNIDPTINTYVIITEHTGNFSNFLKLINFQQTYFSEDELPFISEIIQQLSLNDIEAQITSDNEEITNNNVIQRIKKHEIQWNQGQEYSVYPSLYLLKKFEDI